MATNNFFRSDLQNIYHIVQSSALVYPKEMIITVLRDFFSKDSFYHYVKDEYGFTKLEDHTDIPIDAGINNDAITRIFINHAYPFDSIYYPAILVRSNGAKYVPLSANREAGSPLYESILYEDGYGNKKTIYTPRAILYAGIWEGSISIDVIARSIRARDDISELVGICFADVMFDTLKNAGIVVKPPNIGSPSESDDRNDKLFRQTITLDVRTEWRREIPIKNIIDSILISTDLVNLQDPNSITDPNFTINLQLSFADNIIQNL